jgi:hypothetical protein
MEELAARHDPAELNRIGFRLYERFRPEVPPGNEGWGAKAVLEIEKILTADARPVPTPPARRMGWSREATIIAANTSDGRSVRSDQSAGRLLYADVDESRLELIVRNVGRLLIA